MRSKSHSFLYSYDLQNSKADSFAVRMTFIPELPVIYMYIYMRPFENKLTAFLPLGCHQLFKEMGK